MLVACTLFTACKEKRSEKYIIGVSQCSNDEWRQKMNLEMQHEALLHPEISLIIQTVTDDTEKQIADIQSFINQKADLIIVAPNQAHPHVRRSVFASSRLKASLSACMLIFTRFAESKSLCIKSNLSVSNVLLFFKNLFFAS